MAQGRRVVSEARLAAPRSVPGRERAEKTRAAGGPRAGESPAHAPQVAPGGHLRFALQLFNLPHPPHSRNEGG